jgi:hypothetical protein
MNHDLKIEKPYLQAKLNGDKLFEIRVDDRGYQKGDTVTYTEHPYGKDTIKHTYLITYVTAYNQPGMYVVFGERHISSTQGGEPFLLDGGCDK